MTFQDNPDWTGRNSLQAAPFVLVSTLTFNLSGGGGTITAFGLPVTATSRARLFGAFVPWPDIRWTHQIGLQLITVGTNIPVGILDVGPNKPTDRWWWTPPIDLVLNTDLRGNAEIISGVVGDAETVLLTLLYAIVT